jgi:hypothetical protein
MIDNDNYSIIKQLIKEKSLIELISVLRIAGERLFKDKEDLQPILHEIFLLMMLNLKFFSDPEISPDDLDTITQHINTQLNRMEKILEKHHKKRHLTLIK